LAAKQLNNAYSEAIFLPADFYLAEQFSVFLLQVMLLQHEDLLVQPSTFIRTNKMELIRCIFRQEVALGCHTSQYNGKV
jgi:hypothetical protein